MCALAELADEAIVSLLQAFGCGIQPLASLLVGRGERYGQRTCIDLDHAKRRCFDAEPGEIKQHLDVWRALAEAVLQFVRKVVDVLKAEKPLQPGIQVDPQDGLGHVLDRDAPGCAEVQSRRAERFALFVLGPSQRVFKQLLVEACTDQMQVPGLVFTQKVPCPAQFEVSCTNLKAGAQPVEGFERGKPRPRRVGNLLVGRRVQIGDALCASSTHAAAQLVQL